jgi:copper chaperone CopZ
MTYILGEEISILKILPFGLSCTLKNQSKITANKMLKILMAGPAVNFASMLVVGKVLGKKTLSIYLLSVVLGSFLCGLAIDYLLPREWFVMPWTQMQSVVEHSHSFLSFNSLCTLVMIGLLVNAFVRKHSHGHSHSDCGCSSCTSANDTCSTSEIKMQEFKVEGMRCNHCKANVEKAVSSIQGVESVEVSLEDKIVLVKGNFTPDEVKKAIEELGFSAF